MTVDIKLYSPVYLGYTEIFSEERPTTVKDWFVGGRPNWLAKGSIPPKELTSCLNCHDQLVLMLQVAAPMEDIETVRVIYVFGCKNNGCEQKKGSIRAIRGMKRRQQFGFKNGFSFEDERKDTRTSVGRQLKGNSEEALDMSPKATVSTINDVPLDTPGLPFHFINLQEETFPKNFKREQLDEIKNIYSEYKPTTDIDPIRATRKLVGDVAFERFSDIISYNSTQILRYQPGGDPIFFCSQDDVYKQINNEEVPKPAFNPSSSRQFELQIMPKLIMDFEKGSIGDCALTKWGTIILFTDFKNAMPTFDENDVGYVEEWVGVQWINPVETR